MSLEEGMTEDLDVAIVGGGPGGLSAGVCASLADSDLKIKVCNWCYIILLHCLRSGCFACFWARLLML